MQVVFQGQDLYWLLGYYVLSTVAIISAAPRWGAWVSARVFRAVERWSRR